LATYRPQVRGPVEKAYQALQAKPTDADANGNLGMLLHAFEQLEWQICYRRARALISTAAATKAFSSQT
jgi:hypothetical protein